MSIYFITKSKITIKVSLTSLSTFEINFNNINIAIKKKGIDYITTTTIIVVVEISLLAS